MAEPADSAQSVESDALVAISQLYDVTHGPGNALRALTSAGVDAVGAHGGAIVSRDREGAVQALSAEGVSSEVAASLAEAVGAASKEAGVGMIETADSGAALALPFVGGHGVAGALVLVGDGLDGAAAADLTVAQAAAARAAGFIESARLREDLDRAMAQILETDERMMGRIGLDIHDGPTQQLSVALLEVQLLEAELDDAAGSGAELPTELRPALMRIYETLGGALHEMRELIGHLRPAQFEDRALDDIVRDGTVAFEARGDVTISLVVKGEFPVNGVSISQRITFYRVLQETLSNAQRHGAASHITVTLTNDGEGVELVVADDGSGFDETTAFRKSSRGPQSRVGLQGMRDRAQVLGGSLNVSSTAGEGTTVRLHIPAWSPPEHTNGAS